MPWAVSLVVFPLAECPGRIVRLFSTDFQVGNSRSPRGLGLTRIGICRRRCIICRLQPCDLFGNGKGYELIERNSIKRCQFVGLHPGCGWQAQRKHRVRFIWLHHYPSKIFGRTRGHTGGCVRPQSLMAHAPSMSRFSKRFEEGNRRAQKSCELACRVSSPLFKNRFTWNYYTGYVAICCDLNHTILTRRTSATLPSFLCSTQRARFRL